MILKCQYCQYQTRKNKRPFCIKLGKEYYVGIDKDCRFEVKDVNGDVIK